MFSWVYAVMHVTVNTAFILAYAYSKNVLCFQRLFEKRAVRIVDFCDGPYRVSVSGETRSNMLYIQYYSDSRVETAVFTLVYEKIKGIDKQNAFRRDCNGK